MGYDEAECMALGSIRLIAFAATVALGLESAGVTFAPHDGLGHDDDGA